MLHVFPFLNFDLIYMMFYSDMSLASESRAQPGKPYPRLYGDLGLERVPFPVLEAKVCNLIIVHIT